MPLPLPNLDDRRWADLVDEGRALIPRYAPRWTDHNVHDPGITLIELFAWLTEMTVYRLNRVPARHRRKFLELIGYSPLPPRAATTALALTPDPATPPFELPAGVQFEALASDGAVIPFRTMRDLSVGDVQLAAVQVRSSLGGFADRTRDWRDGLPIEPFGRDPQPGAALYLGFAVVPTQLPLALAFRLAEAGAGAEERERIRREEAARRADCRPVRPDIPCGGAPPALPAPVDELLRHHSARTVWESFTSAPGGWVTLDAVAGLARAGVGQVRDDTRDLSLDGMVEVNLPASLAPTVAGVVATPLFYLRCQLDAGAYDTPPSLSAIAPNGVVAEQAIPAWRRLSIAAGVVATGTPPVPGGTTGVALAMDDGVVTALSFQTAVSNRPVVRVLDFVAPTVTLPGEITWELIPAGVGTGLPGQAAALPEAPVLVDTLRVYTHDGTAWQEWTRREDFMASRRTDFHFAVDATSGIVTFADGDRGRVPPTGALILATYHVSRAEQGNVASPAPLRAAATPQNDVLLAPLPAGARSQLARIAALLAPAAGGAAAEELAHAAGRAVEVLHAHERLLDLCTEARCRTLDDVVRQQVRSLRAPTRGVNLLDIERLALDVPGTHVARARAWASAHPDHPCLDAPGVVTVVIVPDLPRPRPEPSPGLLRTVKRYLARRRMICTRLEVVGPSYLEVRVAASVRTCAGASEALVERRIREALNAFLDPRTGGPAGAGWPFGRDVYRSEILQLLDGVTGVDHVLELTLQGGAGGPRCGDLPLCPTWLVTPGEHRIAVNRPLPAGRPPGDRLRPCASPHDHSPIP